MTWEAKVNTPAAKIFLANNDAQTRDSGALPPTADRLQHLLSQRYEVQVVDGIDALTTIQQQQPPPDLVIADVVLAGSNDWEWLRSLRSNPQTQDLTVFLLSAQAEEEICAAALAAGADDYLSQPFSDYQFLARIEVNLKMRQVRQATVIRQQELAAELATTKQEVTNILESMTDAFYTLDRDWCLTYINGGGESVFGKSRHELLGKNLWELYPALVTQIYPHYHRAITEGVPINFEFYYQPCDFWYDIHVYPSEAGISVYFHNISEKQMALRDRQQAEWAKQKSETVLNAFLASSPSALAFLDRDFRYVHANEALAAMNGIPVSEHIGRTLSEVLPERASQITPILEQVIQSQEPVLNQEISQEINSAGDLRHTLVSYYPVCLSDGYLLGVGITAIDITRIKQVEQALRESEVSLRLANERFELAAKAVNCLIYDWDIQHDTVERTEGITRILGYSLADTQPTGEWWRELVHPEDLPHVQAQTVAAWANNQDRFAVEYRVRNSDNQYINVLDQGIVVEWGADGQPTRVVGSTTDISEKQTALRKRRQAEAAVQASEERLRSFFEANLVGIIFGDEDGSILEANQEFLRIVGYTRADLQTGQLRWADITPPEYFDQDELGIAEAKVKGVCTPYEKEFIRKDGSRVPVVVGYSLLRESRQQSVAFILDISSRKQTERALYQSEARFQAFMDNSPAAAWITDAQGKIVYLSPTYSKTFKLLTDDAIGKTIFDLYPADIAEKFLDNIKKVAQTNQVVEAIELAPLPDETMGDFLVYKFPIADSSGQRLVGGVAVDITERERALRERQQAEQALQKHSDRLKLLSETASDLLSTEHPLELMNDLFAKLSEQMDLQLYLNYLIDTQDNRQKLRLKSWSGIDEQTVQSIEWLEIGEAVCGLVAQTHRQIIVNNVQHSTHPNTRMLCNLNITAYAAQPLIARGKLLGVLSFGSRTRTHFTPEEIALLQATSDQIAIALERAELVASLQQQTEQLIQANRIKDEFLAVLSHELRTPLNPILGWSHLLRTQNYDRATTHRALETIERNAKLQTELIEDLLDVSRILQGKLSLNITQVDLGSTIATAIETIRLAAEAKRIQLQVVVQPNIAPVVGDSARLQQIVWNLLSNAVKFSPKNEQIEIRLESQGSQVQLQVQDTGKGISPEFLPYVFDYFRQADGTSTRKFGGLGLGLAIVRHLVELHGGTVKAESPGEGQGATFTVTLPLIQLHLESNHNDQQLNFSPDLAGVKVLVVDDDVDTRELISFILEQSGAEVMQARSALEALQALTHFQPHVLLSDIGMPDMDGYMLIRQLRTMPSESGRQIPAIALTAYAGEINQQQALSSGFQTHITKPINPTDLTATIAKAVGRDNWTTC
ncbi:MAG: PAS domain S-box protein [Aulosira sp. DedQUE10]|nr:PAS domain S-box protein [Aulosira sp. DedQUE10]